MAIKQSTVSQTDAAVEGFASSMTMAHVAALSLTIITGLIHLYLYTTDDWLPFFVAGTGFFGVVGLFFALKNYRRYLYLAAIPYTLAQIGGYILFPMGPFELAVLDKLVQAALVVTLAYLYIVDRKQPHVIDLERE